MTFFFIFLVDIKVLDQPFFDKVHERPAIIHHLLDVLLRDTRDALFNDD